MLTLLGPFLRKCYCFSGCTNTRVAFFFNPGMDQLSHLDSKKSASGSHRSDIWVRNISWIFWCKRIIILFLRTSYYNSLLVEQSMMLNRRSDDGKKSRKFDFKTKHFRWAHSSNLFHLVFQWDAWKTWWGGGTWKEASEENICLVRRKLSGKFVFKESWHQYYWLVISQQKEN